jgi:DNA-binding protein HU-beta
MNRKGLVDAIAEKTGLSKKDTDNFLNGFIEVVSEQLKKGDTINLVGFGSFRVIERKARTARNPRTGATVNVPARKAPAFKAGKELKEAVN